MSFYKEYLKYRNFNFKSFFSKISDLQIRKILNKDSVTLMEYLSLLSPAAKQYIEAMARKANSLTVKHFGKSVLMYAPLYLSNYCVNKCVYCGFNTANNIERRQLSFDEVEKEAKAISSSAIKHIIVLTGDAPKIATLDYISKCVGILKKYFAGIAVEVYAMPVENYAKLAADGVDSLTIYQETYDEALYDKLHIKGPKKDYGFRLDAPERACLGHMRSVNIGALLGLKKEFYEDVFFMAMHADYLQNKFINVEIGASFPRICSHNGNAFDGTVVSDFDLVQAITAFRIFMPRAGITISTRENAPLRDSLLPLGITKMSAGSKTGVGGYYKKNKTGQFDVSDKRGVREIKKALLEKGYQPVFKNWDIL